MIFHAPWQGGQPAAPQIIDPKRGIVTAQAICGSVVVLMMTMFPTLGQFELWAEETKHDLQNQF